MDMMPFKVLHLSTLETTLARGKQGKVKPYTGFCLCYEYRRNINFQGPIDPFFIPNTKLN